MPVTFAGLGLSRCRKQAESARVNYNHNINRHHKSNSNTTPAVILSTDGLRTPWPEFNRLQNSGALLGKCRHPSPHSTRGGPSSHEPDRYQGLACFPSPRERERPKANSVSPTASRKLLCTSGLTAQSSAQTFQALWHPRKAPLRSTTFGLRAIAGLNLRAKF